jgi:CheY-like chemotaxis protein
MSVGAVIDGPRLDGAPASGRECGVLVVEDHAGVRDALADLVELEGYEVSTAADGKEALRYLRNNPAPRLILLDLVLPGTTGWEVAAELSANPELSSIPVVLLSGTDDVEEQARILGVTGFLRKPIDPDILIQVLEMYCG